MEISNKTLKIIIYGFTIRFSVNIVKVALNLSTKRWIIFLGPQKFGCLLLFNFSMFEFKLAVQVRA